MATIEQIEQRAADIRGAEARALRNLAEHLREAIIDLPVESRLALAFAKRAGTFDRAARASDIALHGKGELWMLAKDVDDFVLDEAQPSKIARDALLMAAEVVDDELATHIRTLASNLDRYGRDC